MLFIIFGFFIVVSEKVIVSLGSFLLLFMVLVCLGFNIFFKFYVRFWYVVELGSYFLELIYVIFCG